MRSSSVLCSSLAVIWPCQAASPGAAGAWCCWWSQSTASGPSFLLFVATPELHFEQGWIWISPWFSGFWLVLLSATGHALQSHPYITFVSGWFQTPETCGYICWFFSNTDCFGGSFKPVCNRVRNVLPGALLQLLHDETVLELFSVIMIVVLVWKCFQVGKLKGQRIWARENNQLLMFLMKVCLMSTAKIGQPVVRGATDKWPSPINSEGKRVTLLYSGRCSLLRWVVDSNWQRPEAGEEQRWSGGGCHVLGVLWVWECCRGALLCSAKETDWTGQRSERHGRQLVIQGVERVLPDFIRL